MSQRFYHLAAINERTKARTFLTTEPCTHQVACTLKARFTYHPARRIQLVEVPQRAHSMCEEVDALSTSIDEVQEAVP